MDRSLSLRVVTYNIRHGRGLDGRVDLEATLATLRRAGADWIGLQEVDRGRARSGRVDQAAWLAARLGVRAVFGPSLRAGGGDGGDYGNALLCRGPVAEVEVQRLPALAEPRTCLWARVGVGPGPGAYCWVGVTHLGLPLCDRRRQVRALAARIERLSGPVILLGDFNATPGAEELTPLHALLVDAAGAAGLAAGTYRGDDERDRRRGLRIDFVWVSREIGVRRAEVLESRASDHLPLVVDLSLPARP